ncbi:CDP-alcohol phosphatidyltransferase [Luteitalea sp. TBR-22]|uniref:CDP-alcohol phosphatidyltransferase family protein n=1 Tax=Luteitalea sp. TBR-22 TaxID=2802971 RepID=UPI001AFA84D7|nr:CDP-alcohol phosphatidyltransferase family protein [Luteitalea sp. TBR-22]BCS33701.1 CDP-alcohol phosphatidyltransferase [Luteitalea sp. TBR-22]
MLTFANQLTLLRMLLIPVFAILLVYGQVGWALTVFVVASATDLLDGYVARRSGPTTLGAWLDPVADKLLLLTMFVVLTFPLPHLTHRIPLWLTVVVASRDVGIVLTVSIVNLALGPRTFYPSIWGKLATATFAATGVVTLFYNWLATPSAVPGLFAIASGVITVVSALHYLLTAQRPGTQPS